MKIERNTPHEWGDENVTRVLRDVYASPAANASYWETLESRIMARIAAAGESPTEWWGVFHGWGRIGIAAALLAGVLAGAALTRARESEERLAYEAVMESASVIPVAGPTVARGPGRGARDATLRSLISY
jgi:anti-sigma-K factor RskA